MAVGEAELGEAAGGPVLEAPQRLDVVLDEGGLVRLGGGLPRAERRVLGRGHVLVEAPLLERVGAAEPLPVEVGPALRLEEVGGLGHGLGAELADPAHEAGQPAGEVGQVALVAVVPAEVEVRVGAVEGGRVRQHAGVRDDRP